MTVDEKLKPLSVPVRVGQAVDLLGQAGRPKTITGSQTQLTPVLLGAEERAELATEKYTTCLCCMNDKCMFCQLKLILLLKCTGTFLSRPFLKALSY